MDNMYLLSEDEHHFRNIHSQALKMISDDGDFDRLTHRLFVFSPFEALGVADYEIRHGNFLAHILNPNAPHGFGDAVLVTFLKRLLGGNVAPAKLAHILINGIGSVMVQREWHKIDILIALNDPELKLIIVIELKLHAHESENQLENYTHFIENHDEYKTYDKHYVFMTPEGAESSHRGWRDFNMTAGFINDLKQLAMNDKGHETARAMLSDYVRIMEQRFMNEKDLNDLAEKLWAKYPDALYFLSDNRPDRIGNLFDHLRDNEDWDYSSKRRLLRTFPEWDSVEGMLMGTDNRLQSSKRLLFLEILRHAEGIRAMFIIGPGDQESRRKILQALIESKADTGRQRTTENMSTEWTTLGSEWLFRSQEVDTEEPQFSQEQKMNSRLDQFVGDQTQKISNGLRRLIPQG